MVEINMKHKEANKPRVIKELKQLIKCIELDQSECKVACIYVDFGIDDTDIYITWVN